MASVHDSPFHRSGEYPAARSCSEKSDDYPSPRSPSSNPTSYHQFEKRDISSETGLGSLAVAGVAGAISVAGLAIAYRQTMLSDAALRLQTAVAAAGDATKQVAQSVGAATESGARSTIREADRVARAISAGGAAAAGAAQTGAGCIVNGIQGQVRTASNWAASVASLASPPPALNRSGRRSLFLSLNKLSPWPSAPAVAHASPIALEAYDDQEQDMPDQLGDLRRTSDGRLRYFTSGVTPRVTTINEDIFRTISSLPDEDAVEVASTIAKIEESIGSDSGNYSFMTAQPIDEEASQNVAMWRNE